MRFFMAVPLLLLVVTVSDFQFGSTRSAAQSPKPTLNGRWSVKFSLSNTHDKILIFEAKPDGTGTFLGLNTAADDKRMTAPVPAVWSELTDQRVSFSAGIELPLGTCCRETGTLIFKGTRASDESIKGRSIFITSTIDEENFIGFRSDVGTFTATREKR